MLTVNTVLMVISNVTGSIDSVSTLQGKPLLLAHQQKIIARIAA